MIRALNKRIGLRENRAPKRGETAWDSDVSGFHARRQRVSGPRDHLLPTRETDPIHWQLAPVPISDLQTQHRLRLAKHRLVRRVKPAAYLAAVDDNVFAINEG